MFKQYQYFLSIARHLSLKEAALELGVSQPTLSISISKLEAELGVKLLHRRSKGVALTDYGKALVEHAQTLYSETSKFRNQLQKLQLRELGQIKVGVGEAWWEAFAKQTICNFRNHHPQSLLHLQFGNNQKLFEQLKKGEIDVLIGHELPQGASLTEVNFLPLFSDEEWFYVREDHPLTSVDGIEDYPTLAVTPFIDRQHRWGEHRHAESNAQYEVDSLYASVDILCASDAVMPYTNKLASWLEQRSVKALKSTQCKTGMVGLYTRLQKHDQSTHSQLTTELIEQLKHAANEFVHS